MHIQIGVATVDLTIDGVKEKITILSHDCVFYAKQYYKGCFCALLGTTDDDTQFLPFLMFITKCFGAAKYNVSLFTSLLSSSNVIFDSLIGDT